jgi:hypothetical protein
LAFANHERKYLTVYWKRTGRFAIAPKSPFPVEVIPHTHGIAREILIMTEDQILLQTVGAMTK